MAEDESKSTAAGKRPTSKTPAAKAAAETASNAEAAETGVAENPKPQTGTTNSPPSGAGPRRSRSSRLLWGFALVAVVAAILLAWPDARDRVAAVFSGADKPAPQFDAAAKWGELGDRLRLLEGTVTQLRAEIAGLKSAPPPVNEEDRAALRSVEDRLVALASAVKAIEGRLVKPAAPSMESGTLALMALAGALRRGEPFASLAARVRRDLAAESEEEEITGGLDGLNAYADKGVPVMAALAAGLDALRPTPANTDARPPKANPKAETPSGFWDKVKTNFKNLVTIRRKAKENPVAPDPNGVARAAAAQALARGDLGAAIQESAGLAGAGIEAWRRDLHARIGADRLASALDRAIAKRLAPKAGQP